jgi:DHA2 family methylenomycin A resistance protein-like MFS transporter
VSRAAASLALAVVLLDVTAVAVLVPDTRVDLGSSALGGQWVLNAYLLALAAPLPLFARLAAARDARGLAAAGALAMAAGAVACALSDSTAALVAGRAVQGAGAGAVLACAAGALRGDGRGTLAVAAAPALALALGPLVGGVFAEQNWWRVFFWAGVPLAVAAGTVAVAAPRASQLGARPSAGRLLAYAAGLTALTVALVQSEAWPWGWFALCLAVGAGFLRSAPLEGMRGAGLAWAAAAGCLAPLCFLAPQYFQLARNLSGLRSGTLLLAVTLPAVAAWALSRSATGRVPAAAAAVGGFGCAAIGLAGLGTLAADTSYAIVIGTLGLAGAGLGVAAGAAAGIPTGESPPRLAASALAGAAVGLACAGGAFQSVQADERAGGASFEQALAHGIGWAALFLLPVLAAVALMVWRLRRPAAASR